MYAGRLKKRPVAHDGRLNTRFETRADMMTMKGEDERPHTADGTVAYKLR
jgi:hypothetical protein